MKKNNFKIGDTIESLMDCNITETVKEKTTIYRKGDKGKILDMSQDKLLVNFENGYDDGIWIISKANAKLIKSNSLKKY